MQEETDPQQPGDCPRTRRLASSQPFLRRVLAGTVGRDGEESRPVAMGAGCEVHRAVAAVVLGVLALAHAGAALAQEQPYFVTYTHHMEEPGSLELGFNPVVATQRGGGDLLAGWVEVEYGLAGWWTTELYLDGQATHADSTVFTGVRWENRFRLSLRELPVNPVLYLEYEDINGADKTMLEVVGHDVEADHAEPNAESRREREREVETKLILSGQSGGWNLAGNLIAEKNLAGEPWEFGYALGASRPLALAARPEPCTLCPENFTAGVELYGGLGDQRGFGLHDTSHYLAAVLAWNLPDGLTLRLSPGFGLNRDSHQIVLRLSVSYEFERVWHRRTSMEGGGRS
jgi:hypothetical protein